MDELTEDQKGLVAVAMIYGPFPCKPEYLPDCHRLYERGWFEWKLIGEILAWRLTPAGLTALELGAETVNAQAAMN